MKILAYIGNETVAKDTINILSDEVYIPKYTNQLWHNADMFSFIVQNLGKTNGWYKWYFDHDHLTQSEIDFFELDENLLDPDGNYEGEDYPNLDMDQDYESFCWDCRNYVCFCWDCIENLLKEFEEIFSTKINNEIIEKHRDEIYNYILVTH